MENKFVIKVYYDDEFVGYVKNVRVTKNYKYRFTKTLNIYEAKVSNDDEYFKTLMFKLLKKLDKLYHYNRFYSFGSYKITSQDVRESKLKILNSL
jgi:hypothetical protein